MKRFLPMLFIVAAMTCFFSASNNLPLTLLGVFLLIGNFICKDYFKAQK